ncbi:hypothetical protein QWY79_13280 [Halomonas sabkhae]|uniref:hypothetical protein n=1 Tax=Halomonas sabkhae TaxID=626223 RepID=UPI0025B57976|nr:hypothetical protein [Halomonas sabkhae]MDN3526237.1 hypothetical protein [Halomonas sabkhae]
MIRKFSLPVAALGFSFLMTGCLPEHSESPQIDQSSLCIATTDQQAMECPEGELFMARLTPSNRDLRAFNTLNTAALYCDTNYPIFENNAGIICVLTHQRVDMLTEGEASSAGMESNQQAQRDKANEDNNQ